MRRFPDLLFILMLLAIMANSQVMSAEAELDPAAIEERIRKTCESAPLIYRSSGFQKAKATVSELLMQAEALPGDHDLIPLIYLTLSELSLGQGKVKQSFHQLISAANAASQNSDKDFLIRILEQGIILNVLSGQPNYAIGLLGKWEKIGFNDKDLWRGKFLYYKALASYFVSDEDTLKECLDRFARLTDGDIPPQLIRNTWLLESMIACLEGYPELASAFLDELEDFPEAESVGGYYYLVHALQDQAEGAPAHVVEQSLEKAKMAYEMAGRPGLYPLMLALILRHKLSDARVEDWLAFHKAMSEYAQEDDEPIIAAFGYFSRALPKVQGPGEKLVHLRAGQKKLVFAESLIGQLQLKMSHALDENLFPANGQIRVGSNFYTTILLLLLIVLMLVMILRIRTQWLINRRLRESVEKSRMAERAAAHASKLKSEFVSNISHEIKTPMGGLVGMTSILDELITDPVQRKYLETIRECSRNLMTLLDDLLDLGRIEAGRLEIDEVPFSLSATVEYCQQMVFHRAYDKDLEFTIEKSDSLPDIFIGDPTRIGQVLINLLNNAIKFTNRGSVLLKVEFEETEEQLGKLILSVEDTGVGISPEQIRTVFEPFNQTNHRPGMAEEGSGLGLAISKQLVDLMGGTLSVSSEPNVGSIFIFALSLRRADNESYNKDE